MESSRQKRHTIQALVSEQAGSRTTQENLLAAQRRADPHRAALAALPVRQLDPIQDFDPASPTFGEFVFILGQDPIA